MSVSQSAIFALVNRADDLDSFEGKLCTCLRVLYLLGRYFYTMYEVKMLQIVFSFNVKDNNICPCLHNNETLLYRNDSVMCQSECASLHKTVNMVVSFLC